MIKRIINWFLGLFQKSETPELDAKIEAKKDRIEELDKELDKEYDSVKSAMDEWK
jgi:hypothetical protein